MRTTVHQCVKKEETVQSLKRLIGEQTRRRASSIAGFLEPGEWWKIHLEY